MRFTRFRFLLFLATGLGFFALSIELWMLHSLIFLLYLGLAFLLFFISLFTFFLKKRSISLNHLLLMVIILTANFSARFTILHQQERTLARAERVVRQIERFKTERGQWPAKLEQIVPDYLEQEDLFTAYGLGLSRQPFNYGLYTARQERAQDQHFKLTFGSGLTSAYTYSSSTEKWQEVR